MQILKGRNTVGLFLVVSKFLFLVFKNILHLSTFIYFFRIDPRTLDTLLGEIVLMNARTELYFRFLKNQVVVSIDKSLISKDLDSASSNLINSEHRDAWWSIRIEISSWFERCKPVKVFGFRWEFILHARNYNSNGPYAQIVIRIVHLRKREFTRCYWSHFA